MSKDCKPFQIQSEQVETEEKRVFRALQSYGKVRYGIRPYEMEVRLQKIMEQYAGGASLNYEMNEETLQIARKQLVRLPEQFEHLVADDLHSLMKVHEIVDRVDVAQVLVEHLIYRKETRWPSYQTRVDYPNRDDLNWLKFANSRRDPKTGEIKMFTRPYEQLVSGDRYRP